MTSPSDDLERLAVDTIRTLSIDGVQQANSGHPGAPMGVAAMAYALWTSHLRHAPTNPAWPDRDRFVLSAGHASMLLYSLLHLTGYAVSLDDLQLFRQWGSDHPGSPRVRHDPGRGGHHRPAGPGPGQRRRHGHRGAPPRRGVQPARPRRRRPPHVRHLLGRRPAGGHHRGGELPRRSPEAGQADRPLRRQPDPARRPHRLDVHRGRARALCRVRLAHPAHRGRERRRGDLGGHRGRARPTTARRSSRSTPTSASAAPTSRTARSRTAPRSARTRSASPRRRTAGTRTRASSSPTRRASCSAAPSPRARRSWPTGRRASPPMRPTSPPRRPSSAVA